MKRILSFLMCIVFAMSLLPQVSFLASAAESGTCGDNLTWTLDGGLLTISGKGEMGEATWLSVKDDIKQVVIEDGVTSIGEAAFENCTKLRTVTLPDTMLTIGSSAFSGCTQMSVITISKNVSEIGDFAFLESYVTIKVNENNPYFSVVDNILYDKNQTELLMGGGALPTHNIPATVTSVADYAFYKNAYVKSIVLPESVASIGKNAFDSCTQLTSISIPTSVESVGQDAFKNSEGIVISCYEDSWIQQYAKDKDISYSVSGKRIEDSGKISTKLDWKFYEDGLFVVNGTDSMIYGVNWESVKKKIKKVVIEDGVTLVDGFDECTALTDVIIAGSVKSIYNGAFEKCTSLKNVVMQKGMEEIGAYVFYDCSSLESIVLPEGLTEISTSAFQKCTKLKDISIPDSATDIWSQVFWETAYYNDESNWEDGVLYIGNHLVEVKDGTNTVNIKDGTINIAYSAFANCGLKNVTIPDSVKRIGVAAFVNCGIKGIVIPNGVTKIDERTFVGCSSLVNVVIPESVVSIADDAFRDCENVVLVCKAGSYAQQYAIEKNIKNAIVLDEGTCGENAKWVLYDNGNLEINGSGAMYNYTEQNKAPWCDMTSNIEKVIIGDGITTVGDYTFSHCEALKTVETAKSIVSIGKYAFYQCVALKTVKTSAYITKIEDHAFCNCNFMEDLLFYDTYDIGSRSFPGTLTSIGDFAFFGCWYLDEVNIPSSVESIGDDAFNDNSAYITVNENNTNYSSYSGALCNKDKTVLISAGGVKDGFVIDSTINTIAAGAFLRNHNLTYVTFVVDSTRDTLINIESMAFYGCSALRSISIPKGVKYIGYYAFQNCEALETIEIPESVTTIEEDAFAECPLLVISCYKDSYAHTYAVENNIQYTLKNNSSGGGGGGFGGGGGGGGGSSKPKPKPEEPKVGLVNFKAHNEYKAPFTDVAQNSWYHDSVKTAYELDLVKGAAEGKYNPAGNITIAEAITLVARIHSIYTNGKAEFTQGDVWYKVYVDYAVANGIIAENQFADFNKPATREEFAKIFSKAIPEDDFNAINSIENGKIPDISDDGAVYLLYRAGILAGSDEAHSFKPETNIQRSEVATIVTRIVDKGKRVTFEIE